MRFYLLITVFTVFTFAKDLKPISIQLLWKYQFQFAGYIMAKEKGFYKDVGLDVNLVEFKSGVTKFNEVDEKKADFSITASGKILKNLNENKNYVFLLAMAQSSPIVLTSVKENGIEKIEDIKGKRHLIMSYYDKIAHLSSMYQSQGINEDNFKIVKGKSWKLTELVDGTADITRGYLTITPYHLKKMGYTPIIFDPKDYGYDFYSDMLYTTKEFVEQNPETTKKFYEASLKGWEYAFSNIKETIDIIKSKYDTQKLDRDILEFEAKAWKKLAFVPNIPFGDINSIKLEKIINAYKLLNLTKSNLTNFEDFIYKTNNKNQQIPLTTNEQKLINEHLVFKVGFHKNLSPIQFINNEGLASGISKDILNVISEKTGMRFVYIPLEGNQLSKKLQSNKIDFYISRDNENSFFNFTIESLENQIKNISLSFKTNNETLQSILEKATKELNEKQKESILRKWIPKLIEKPFDWTIIWILSTLFSFIIIILLYRNIRQKNSEQHRLEILVEEKTKDLENLLSNFKVFTGNSIHQIRVPLTVINLYNDMLEDTEIKRNIKSSLVTMEHIYDNLAYKVRKDYLEFKKEKVCLSEILNQRIELFEVVINANDKTLSKSIQKDIFIEINKIQLEYIIDNNLSNAIKYGTTKKIIFVKLIKKNEKITLSFSNEGKEIQNKEKIFDRFTRETVEKQGQGIGLHMVKEICDLYEIKIKVEYIEGRNKFSYTFL